MRAASTTFSLEDLKAYEATPTRLGRFFLATSMAAFGVQHFIYLDFVTRVFPRLPAWIPGHSFLACVFGALLLSAGAAMMVEKTARLTALLLGTAILVSFALLYLPLLVTTPPNGGLWTRAGKALGLSGGSFLVVSSLPVKSDSPGGGPTTVIRALENLVPLGRFFLAAFLILCGVEHFIYIEFTAGMVPSWIPGHVFWAYFAGVALIAGGVGISIPLTSRLAASLSGLMIFLWVMLLHIPRVAADLHNANEVTALFEALAFSGAAFLAAATPKSEKREYL